jgi:hypothetical protein
MWLSALDKSCERRRGGEEEERKRRGRVDTLHLKIDINDSFVCYFCTIEGLHNNMQFQGGDGEDENGEGDKGARREGCCSQ